MNIRPVLLCVLVALATTTANAQRFPGFPGIDDFRNWLNQLNSRIDQVIGNLDQQLNSLVGDLQGVGKTLEEVADCYASRIGENDVNIFDGSLNFREIIAKFYEAFPNKRVTRESIQNLLNSVRDIVSRCLDPARRSTAQFGFTELSDESKEQVALRFGVQIPTNSSLPAKRSTGSDPICKLDTSAVLPTTFDWRSLGVVTSVKNQGQCGSCWSFATVGAIESAYLISKQTTASKTPLDLAEQQLVNCAKQNGCNGGHSQLAFSYVQSKGVTAESKIPYTASVGSCRDSSLSPKYAIRDFCIRSKYRYTVSSTAENVSDDTIKRALIQHGPLYFTIDANTLQNYRSGVLTASGCSTAINHAVLLVGYNERAWIVKNSWGAYWGEQGYFQVATGSNVCGVNTEIAWPVM